MKHQTVTLVRILILGVTTLTLLFGVACSNKDDNKNSGPTTVVVTATPTPVNGGNLDCASLYVGVGGYYYDHAGRRYTRSGSYFYDRNNRRMNCSTQPTLMAYDRRSCRSYTNYTPFVVGNYVYCVRESYLYNTQVSTVMYPGFSYPVYTYGWNGGYCDQQCAYTLGGLGLGATAGALIGGSPEAAILGGVVGAIFGNIIGD